MPTFPSKYRPNSYPFGSSLKARGFSAGSGFRFGFNAQEKDNAIYSNNETYTAMFWEYDGRLGRRWNVDPVVKYHESSYSTFANNPIFLIDQNGADTIYASKNTESGKWNITKTQLAKGNDVFRVNLVNYSKQLNSMLGGNNQYNGIGKNNFPGTDFANGIEFKLIQKTGF